MELTEGELILKGKLDQAAKLLSSIIIDKSVYNEVLQFTGANRTTPEISFKQVMNNEERVTKGGVIKFSNLKNALEKAYAKSQNDFDLDEDLLDFLIENDCGIWSPYSLDRYSEDNQFFTVTGHPIDETIPESPGYIYSGINKSNVVVNEEYADNNPVLVITPNYLEIEYPVIEDGIGDVTRPPRDIPVSANKDHEVVKLTHIKLKTVWNTWFWTRTFKLFVVRGEGAYNPVNFSLTGTFPTSIYIELPREYAKDKRWYPVNIVWDTKWSKEKTKQVVGAYRHRNKGTYKISGTVGYKADSVSAQVTASAELEVSGTGLGHSEWDRDWFYETNHLSPTYGGIKVRQTSNVFDFTLSISQL
jgi:hypothetical protein